MKSPEHAAAETDELAKSAIVSPMQTKTQEARGANEEEAIIADLVAKGNLDYLIPQLARDRRSIQRIEAFVRSLKPRIA